MKILVRNRSASFHYQLLDRFEAGLMLLGSEVKSLRCHQASLSEAFIVAQGDELFLHNAHIHEVTRYFGHSARRERKLLLHRNQIHKIVGQITRKGMTAVPLALYLSDKGKIKMELALALGMKKEDKRQSIKEKEWKRQQHRILKQTYEP